MGKLTVTLGLMMHWHATATDHEDNDVPQCFFKFTPQLATTKASTIVMVSDMSSFAVRLLGDSRVTHV